MKPESSENPPERKEPLIETGFVYNDRPVRDVVWTVFFAVLITLSCGLAIFAAVARNEDASQLIHRDYNFDPSYCSDEPLERLNDTELALRRGVSYEEEFADSNKGSNFLEFLDKAWIWILLSTVAAVLLGFVFVLLFSYFAAFMVYFVASLLVLVPILSGLLNIIAYDDAWGWVFIAVGVVICIGLLCLFSQLRLTAKLLDLGADGIRDNLDLAFFSVCTNLILLVVLTGLFCFGVLSLTNGKIEKNGSIDEDHFPESCENVFSLQVDCCDWNMDNWVTGYWVLIIVMMLWCCTLISQIRVYVVAGVVAQWYFADEENRGNMSVFTSLGFALGPSFGSLVLSSLILTIANIVRRISEYLTKRAHDENSRCKWLITCLSCLIEAIAHIIEWVTDFATVRMAITGESFFQAGKSVVEMMKQNLLNAYAIWWFPPLVLYFCSFLISISVSVFLALAARNTWNDDDDLRDVRKWSWYIFFICFFLMMTVLYFFSTLLIDAVYTIFVCFAIDRANNTQKNPKAHEVFISIPGMGPIAVTEGQPQENVRAVVIEPSQPPAQQKMA